MGNINQPLAERMRPKTLKEFYGQDHLVGDGAILHTLIMSDQIPSMILWGPPGTGKTTLARIIAQETAAHFVQLSAINSGVKDVRKAIDDAESYARLGTRTILFVDEVHRFNKAQQDAFLPSVEKGVITLIGATTENPSFQVNNALLSRARVFVLEALSLGALRAIIAQALQYVRIDAKEKKYEIAIDVQDYLCALANGDARSMLNALEVAMQIVDVEKKPKKIITKKHIEQAIQRANLLYDKNGEEHYNLISALHKSMRGGDADAAIYYLARMLAGGEDPLYIARRVVRFASEDIGLANSFALPQAVATYDACRFIGMPECGVNLAQAVVYMAKSKKSISIYEGYNNAMQDARELGNVPVPLHLRNAPTKLMKDLDYGKEYKYTPHATEDENTQQQFLPDELRGKTYIK